MSPPLRDAATIIFWAFSGVRRAIVALIRGQTALARKLDPLNLWEWRCF
jgi:hypothetical protein